MPSWCLKQPGGGKLWSELCPYLTAITMHYLYYGSTNALFKEHFHKAMAPVMQVKKKRHHKTGKFIMRKINFYTTHHVGTCTSKWNAFSYLTFQTIPYSKVLRILKPDNMSFYVTWVFHYTRKRWPRWGFTPGWEPLPSISKREPTCESTLRIHLWIAYTMCVWSFFRADVSTYGPWLAKTTYVFWLQLQLYTRRAF